MKGAKEIHTSYSEKMSENLSDQRLRRKHSITLISFLAINVLSTIPTQITIK